MSTCKRAYDRDKRNLSKTFHRPLKLVASIMPIRFTDDEFYSMFKTCFPGLWKTLVETKKQYDMMDAQRKKQHLKPIYYFPTPDLYLAKRSKAIISNTRVNHSKGKILNEDEQRIIRTRLEDKALKRERKRYDANVLIGNFLQHVKPSHVNYFIDVYFANNGQTQEKVDTRYRILLEASKFRCKATETFMLKVNAIEPNYHLRFFAFQTLQQKFGFPAIKFKRNHHKKGRNLNIQPQKMDTPEKLMSSLYESQFALEDSKKFDIFLSHSCIDRDIVFKTKTILNAKGLSVYVDWIEDKEALPRELTCSDTARIIIERIKHSTAIVYIKTANSSLSLWTPWELGYAHAIQKKICVLEADYIFNTPHYLDIYDKGKFNGDEILVVNQDEIIPVEKWINKT